MSSFMTIDSTVRQPCKELQISYTQCIRSRHSPRSLSVSFLGCAIYHDFTSTLAHSFLLQHVDRDKSFFPRPSFPLFAGQKHSLSFPPTLEDFFSKHAFHTDRSVNPLLGHQCSSHPWRSFWWRRQQRRLRNIWQQCFSIKQYCRCILIVCGIRLWQFCCSWRWQFKHCRFEQRQQ